jgi:retinol dehydrogenase 12
MLDLTDKTVVITGANTGIGRAAALQLGLGGFGRPRLLLCCRDLAKARAVSDEIRAGGGHADCFQLDLADLDSVRRCAHELLNATSRIDVLINNAGLAGASGATRQGFELTFGVNHLGHFLLTELLLARLLQSELKRVINVSSTAHYKCTGIDFEALQRPTRSRTGFAEYRVSKLCNILHAKELQRRYGARGLHAAATHPGVVRSDVWRAVPAPFRYLIKLFMISNERGAATTVKLAACEEHAFTNGGYYHEGQLRAPAALAEDGDLAQRLWQHSADWSDPEHRTR